MGTKGRAIALAATVAAAVGPELPKVTRAARYALGRLKPTGSAMRESGTVGWVPQRGSNSRKIEVVYCVGGVGFSD